MTRAILRGQIDGVITFGLTTQKRNCLRKSFQNLRREVVVSCCGWCRFLDWGFYLDGWWFWNRFKVGWAYLYIQIYNCFQCFPLEMTYSVLVCILHIPEIHIQFSFSNLILPNVGPSESVANLIIGGSCLMYRQSLNPSHVGGLSGKYPAFLFRGWWLRYPWIHRIHGMVYIPLPLTIKSTKCRYCKYILDAYGYIYRLYWYMVILPLSPVFFFHVRRYGVWSVSFPSLESIPTTRHTLSFATSELYRSYTIGYHNV